MTINLTATKPNIMKSLFISSLLFLLVSADFAQNSKFEIPVRQTPKVKKENLIEAKWVTDLSPKLWNNMTLSSNDRYFLNQRRENVFPEPPDYVYPQEKYKQTITYVSVQIAASCNGKTLTALSTSDKLTAEQKEILNTAALGTDIKVTIKYKYKDQRADSFGPRNQIAEGTSTVTVVPQTEAEYPGGWKELSNYFATNVINALSDKKTSEKIQNTTLKFMVNEEGKIEDAKISQTSTDIKLDKLILDATGKMPKWKPAVNGEGVRVKQEITIPFGGEGC